MNSLKSFHLLSLFHWLSPCLSRITVCSKPLPTSMEVSPAPSPIWKSYDVHNLTAKKCENVLLHPLEIFSLPFSLLWRFAGWPRCERRWAAAASWDSMQRLLLASPPSSLTETLTSVASPNTLQASAPQCTSYNLDARLLLASPLFPHSKPLTHAAPLISAESQKETLPSKNKVLRQQENHNLMYIQGTGWPKKISHIVSWLRYFWWSRGCSYRKLYAWAIWIHK